jgi:hypothetical protein
MEDDIQSILEKLESSYDIIENNLFKDKIDYLGIGQSVLEINTLPSIDLPLNLRDYLLTLKNEEDNNGITI